MFDSLVLSFSRQFHFFFFFAANLGYALYLILLFAPVQWFSYESLVVID